ncbi:hypothetical protein [Streptomyces sp. NPDC047841]|uniref:hypothetical protein n=1 Tax=Streptomyces sp. NPDC047841 TaxID=3154708 RepID=UPI003453A853
MIASLLAVLVTVPGTVWAVLVAQSQLHQADEAAVKEERAQASRVSGWASQDAHGKWLFHVMNRSPDPIAQIFLSFAPLIPDAKVSPVWAVMVPSVPPCTDMTISQGQLRYNLDDPFRPLEFTLPIPSLPKTVSYVVIARWAVYGAGYVRLDCSGRAVGDREAVDPTAEGAATGRRNAGHA